MVFRRWLPRDVLYWLSWLHPPTPFDCLCEAPSVSELGLLCVGLHCSSASLCAMTDVNWVDKVRNDHPPSMATLQRRTFHILSKLPHISPTQANSKRLFQISCRYNSAFAGICDRNPRAIASPFFAWERSSWNRSQKQHSKCPSKSKLSILMKKVALSIPMRDGGKMRITKGVLSTWSEKGALNFERNN